MTTAALAVVVSVSLLLSTQSAAGASGTRAVRSANQTTQTTSGHRNASGAAHATGAKTTTHPARTARQRAYAARRRARAAARRRAAARLRARATGHRGGYGPGCVGLGRVGTRPQAWLDNHSSTSQLVRKLTRLICSAADNSTIDIKTWFMLVDDRVMRRFADELRVMHDYHNVTVNLMLGREIYRRNHWSWHATLRALPFAHVIVCYRECGTNAPRTVPHGKWVTISKLRRGGPAVVSLSTNWSAEQFRSAQSGIFVAGDVALYTAFTTRWDQLAACAGSSSCPVPVNSVWYDGTSGASVYFAPIPTDLTARSLRHVDCTGGGNIQVLSMFFHRHPVERQLARLQNEGCTVQIVLEHAPPSRFAGQFPLRCEHQHDKAMVVDVPGQEMVIAGSEALTTHALAINENQMVRTSEPGVVSAYGRYLTWQWHRAHTCSRSGT